MGGRHVRFAAAGASLGILDRIAGLFGLVTREQHARADRQAQRANAGEEHPSGNRVVAIVHACSPVRWRPLVGALDRFGAPLLGHGARRKGLNSYRRGWPPSMTPLLPPGPLGK